MKTILIIMTILVSSWGYGYSSKSAPKSSKIKCKYDFNTKDVSLVESGETTIKRQIGNSIVFIKNTNEFSNVHDYITKIDENGLHKMTYSLSCFKN